MRALQPPGRPVPEADATETGDSGRQGNQKQQRHGRERRCIVTRETLPEAALIRFVAGPDGVVVPDLKARLPGRGAWVRADEATVRLAVRKGHFRRALKSDATVTAPADLAASVGALLTARALEALGMATAQGAVIAGQVKVADGVRKGRFGIVLFAADGAADSRRKLAAALRASPANAPRLEERFTSHQMSLAMGRANVIHAGVVRGRAAAALTVALARLNAFFGDGADASPGAS